MGGCVGTISSAMILSWAMFVGPRVPPAQDSAKDLAQQFAQLGLSETMLWDNACGMFERRNFEGAATDFEEFMRRFPSSTRAPEASFKRALAYTLLKNHPRQKEALEFVIRQYPRSIWANLIARNFIDPTALETVTDELFAASRKANDKSISLVAGNFYALCTHRTKEKDFKTVSSGKQSLSFLSGLAYDHGGATELAKEIWEELAKGSPEDIWGLLACCKTADAKVFASKLKPILAAESRDGDYFRTMLDLMSCHWDSLSASEKLLCGYQRVHCLIGLKRFDEALALGRTYLREHPDSPHAAECAMEIAESEYSRQNLEAAQKLYRLVADNYSRSSLAVRASEWAQWIDSSAADWDEVLAVLLANSKRFAAIQRGIALELQIGRVSTPEYLCCSLAHRPGKHTLVDIKLGKDRFFYQKHGKSCLYYSSESNRVSEVEGSMSFTVGAKQGKDDRTTYYGGFNFNSEPAEFLTLELPGELVPFVMKELKRGFHVHHDTKPAPGGGVQRILRIESQDNPNLRGYLELASDRTIRRAKFTIGHDLPVELTKLQFDEEISEASFQMDPALAKLPRHDDKTFNPFELIGSAMRLLQSSYGMLTAKKPEKGK